MNYIVFSAAVFMAFQLTGWAQGTLLRMTSSPVEWQKNNPWAEFHDKEYKRMLIPTGAAFGVECKPSFDPEWTLTYDSTAHALVYKAADKNIWATTYAAWHKEKRISRKNRVYKDVMLKKPKDYEAPNIKTYTLAISEEQAQGLRTVLQEAISKAEDRKDHIILDGVTWIFFVGNQRAKSRTDKISLVKLVSELAEAVRNGDTGLKDSLITMDNGRWIKEN